MTRRTILASSALLSPGAPAAQSAPAAPPLLKPRALKPGDTVGLITPSTGMTDPLEIENMMRTAAHFGWKAKVGRNVRKKIAYVGGTVAERVADLHDMFDDPEVAGVLCVKGGYGTPHLLDRIDYGRIARNPKVFCGYSDITGLHLAIHRHANLVTFHSPTVLSPFTPWSQEHFRAAVSEGAPSRIIRNPPEANPLRPQNPVRAIRPGVARGRLIGGNLTLISCLMGTPYEPDTRGRIFFLEDVGESPYRMDRMLTQLRLAGKFDHCAGILVGKCVDCEMGDYKPSFAGSSFTLNEMLDSIFGDMKVPVLSGLLIGHTADQATLPLGAMATMDATSGELRIEESGVR